MNVVTIGEKENVSVGIDGVEELFSHFLMFKKKVSDEDVSCFMRNAVGLVTSPVETELFMKKSGDSWQYHGDLSAEDRRGLEMMQIYGDKYEDIYDKMIPDLLFDFYRPVVATSMLFMAIVWRTKPSRSNIEREFHVIKVPSEDEGELHKEVLATGESVWKQWDITSLNVEGNSLDDTVVSILGGEKHK